MPTRDEITADVVVDLDEASDVSAPALASTEVDLNDETVLPAGCDRNADGSVTVRLDYPKKVSVRASGAVSEQSFDALTFHRLTGADLNAMRATAAEHQQLVLFSRSSRVPQRIMTVLYPKLDAKDIVRCGKVLETFL